MVAAGEEVSSGGASRSYEVGLVQNLPWVPDLELPGNLPVQAAKLIELRRTDDTADETTRSFIVPALLRHILRGATLGEAVEATISERCARCLEVLATSLEAEIEMYKRAGLDSDSLDYLDEEVGHHPSAYAEGPLDEDRLARLYEAPLEKVIDEVIAEKGGSRAIANLTYFADRRIEVLAHAFERPAEQIVAARERLRLLPPGELDRSSGDIFSYLVGLAFGRWDIRTGRGVHAPPDLTAPFDSIPVLAPGAVQDQQGRPAATPPDYVLELPPEGILVDEPGHAWDVEDHVWRAATSLVDGADRLIADMLMVFGRSSIREHLRKAFFKEHLSRYSKSRRKAPIYWPLYVPSGSWGVWIYAPSLRRETLFAVASEAMSRFDRTEAEIRRLQRERDSGGAGRSARDVALALEAEEKLAEELRRFRDEANRIAGLGWEPDLDDGIILCAAPLAELFPAWKDAAAARKEIKAGKYPWATVSDWANQL